MWSCARRCDTYQNLMPCSFLGSNFAGTQDLRTEHTQRGAHGYSFEIYGVLVRASTEDLCCVIEQGALPSAKYWLNSGDVLTWWKNCWLGHIKSIKIAHNMTLNNSKFEVLTNFLNLSTNWRMCKFILQGDTCIISVLRSKNLVQRIMKTRWASLWWELVTYINISHDYDKYKVNKSGQAELKLRRSGEFSKNVISANYFFTEWCRSR